ncbi:MAG TPA: sulfatase [Candidatus Hydrogenedentes bacterium]|nr:sulfatase [Candidatus Hydrogenedentota bacterium]
MATLDRRSFLSMAALSAGMWLGGAPRAAHGTVPAEDRKPNIVFILIDDLGYADLGCFGSDFHETPHLDRMAAEGMRFTHAYAAAPVCSPTRASIMTGKYPARLHLTNFLKGTLSPEDAPVRTAPYADQLPLEETTIAEALRDAGYATCHVGKWHLGGKGFWPEDQGFEVNIAGGASGMPRSFFWPDWKGNPPLDGGVDGEYLTDRLTHEACRFIEAHKDRPFFLYLSHYAVHIPLQAKADKIAKYEAKLARLADAPKQRNPHYAAMLESVDESIGTVLDILRRCGIANDTLVVFFSDNGGLSVEEGPLTPATDNHPLRAGKGYLYEGGIREPMIVWRPGAVPPNTVCEAPVTSTDFFPTFCALAGVDPTAVAAGGVLDGVDLGLLFGNPTRALGREALYWHYPHFSNQGGRPAGAVRVGDWKLIEHYEHGNVELFHLRDDIGETNNLAERHLRRARRLRALLDAWRREVDATMPPPAEGR